MGQLPVWNHTTKLWTPDTNTDGEEPTLYRFSATSTGDLQLRAASLALGFNTAGILQFGDYGLNQIGIWKHAFVQTTNATVTTLLSLAMGDPTTHNIVAWVAADQSAGASSAGYQRNATVKRTGGGIATMVGGVTAVHTAEDVAGWDCTIDVDGASSWRVRVTGAAATTINWRLLLLYVPISG